MLFNTSYALTIICDFKTMISQGGYLNYKRIRASRWLDIVEFEELIINMENLLY